MSRWTLIKKWLRKVDTGVNWTQRIERHLNMWTRYADSETVNAWGDMRRIILKKKDCDSRRSKSNIQHRSNELSISSTIILRSRSLSSTLCITKHRYPSDHQKPSFLPLHFPTLYLWIHQYTTLGQGRATNNNIQLLDRDPCFHEAS